MVKRYGVPVYDAFRHALQVVDDDGSVIAYLYGNRCGVCMNIHRQLQIKAFLACVSRCGGKYAILRDFVYYIVNQLFALFRALMRILTVGGKGSLALRKKALPCAGTCFSALRNSVFCGAGKAFLCRPDGVKALAEGRGGGGKGFFVCGGTPDVTLRFSLS